MEHSIFLSPVLRAHNPGDMSDTPIRATERYKRMFNETGIPVPTIRQIIKGKLSKRTQKGKVYKPKLLSEAVILVLCLYISVFI
jgi:hypothetical protein